MKTIWFLIFSLPLLCFAEPRRAITSGGLTDRLGDRLVDYAHLKWVSYKSGIPMLYQPFKYADQLCLDDLEEHYSREEQDGFAKQIPIQSLAQLDQKVDQDTLYILNHYPDSYQEYLFLKWEKKGPYIAVDWTDKKFLELMRSLIKPKRSLDLIKPKEGAISVALHYRTGIGYDSLQLRKWRAMCFPPPEYYLEQLKTLWALVGFKPLYVFIFSDDPDPSSIKAMFEEKINDPSISFDCRQFGNHRDANVLEDLFSMMQFDCIIRPISHFSSIASHLANFTIDISPKHVYWNQKSDTLVVDEVDIKKTATLHSTNAPFIKLDSLPTGMFSIFSNVLRSLDDYEKGVISGLEVDFSRNGAYFDKEFGPNWWLYYCEPIEVGIKDPRKVKRHFIANPRKFSPHEANLLIQKYIHIKPHVMQRVEDFKNANFDSSFVIGLHYRGTDKIADAPRVAYEEVIKKLQEKVDSLDVPYKIFVATDEQAFIDYIEAAFPGKVCYQLDVIRSSNDKPIHVKANTGHYKLGEDALTDCLLLSKTDFLMRTSSNLSLWSTYFNPSIPVLELNQRYK